MSDFDFDELDRAVTGATGNADTTPVESKPVVASVEPPVLASIPSEDTPPAPSTPAARPAPAVRRSSGRFMDMVHTSSDMRTRATPAVVPSVAPAPLPTQPVPASSTGTAEPEKVEYNNDLAAITDDWQKPLESPFLPDAVVEKRPLGGESIASSMKLEDLLDEPDDELLGTGKQEALIEGPDDPRIEATTMPDPIDFAASFDDDEDEKGDDASSTVDEASPLTDESHEIVGDELSTVDTITHDTAETSETSENTEDLDAKFVANDQNSAESLVSTEVGGTSQPPEVIEASEVTQEPKAEPTPLEEPIGPTSITQQYKEQPSSKQESGAIYDTEAYHQPIAKVAKKRSGALAIVWILLLVLLGAGAGAAFYIYVLPML